MHQWSIPSARRELLATGETVRTRRVETRDELPRVVARAIDAISITMRAAGQAFSDYLEISGAM